MKTSRLARVEEKSAKRIIVWSLSGMLLLVILGGVFGLPMLVRMSVFIDSMRGAAPTPKPKLTIMTTPELDPLPEATNSATTTISGVSDPTIELTLIVNNDPIGKTTTSDTGRFTFKNVALADGSNSIRVKRKAQSPDQKDILTDAVLIERRSTKPKLEIESPEDNKTYSGDTNKVLVKGVTDDGNSVTINDHRVIVQLRGVFQYEYPLSEGETTLKILATDEAGNTTLIERKVTYKK